MFVLVYIHMNLRLIGDVFLLVCICMNLHTCNGVFVLVCICMNLCYVMVRLCVPFVVKIHLCMCPDLYNYVGGGQRANIGIFLSSLI